MTQQEALYASILAHPADDTPRMVFADWLEENWDGERAEFIRVQVELARSHELRKSGVVSVNIPMHEWDELRRRERELHSLGNCIGWFTLSGTAILWTATDGLRGWHTHDGRSIGARASRGFISHVTASWSDWQKVADELCWWPARTCEKCRGNGCHLYGYFRDGEPNYSESLPCSACRGTASIPGATMPCPECKGECTVRGADGDETICRTCGVPKFGGHMRGSGRIPRPVSLAMQPVQEVTLMTRPSPEGSIGEDGGRHWDEIGESQLRERWPSVEKWNLPRTDQGPVHRNIVQLAVIR